MILGPEAIDAQESKNYLRALLRVGAVNFLKGACVEAGDYHRAKVPETRFIVFKEYLQIPAFGESVFFFEFRVVKERLDMLRNRFLRKGKRTMRRKEDAI